MHKAQHDFRHICLTSHLRTQERHRTTVQSCAPALREAFPDDTPKWYGMEDTKRPEGLSHKGRQWPGLENAYLYAAEIGPINGRWTFFYSIMLRRSSRRHLRCTCLGTLRRAQKRLQEGRLVGRLMTRKRLANRQSRSSRHAYYGSGLLSRPY